ncbi:MAG: pilin [Thermaerobacter sp.]|nr:pilin [Thermaerobacter sp.]
MVKYRVTMLTWLLWAMLAGSALAQTVPTVGGNAATTITELFANLVRWFQYVAGGVSTAVLAYGALKHMISHTPYALEESKRIMTVAVVGLLIALMAPTIVSLITSLIPVPTTPG